MLGAKLKKSDLDTLFESVQYPKVVVRCDLVGLRLFIESYPGWVSVPFVGVDVASLVGVHPSGVGLEINASADYSGMIVTENYDDPTTVGSFENYT